MRRTLRLVCALAALLGMTAAPAAAQPTAPLGHAGRWITDGRGRVVILHGVNMVNKLPPYAPDAIGFGTDDAAFLQAHGFNSVRLGVLWAGVEPQPGQFDAAYLGRIANTVGILGRHGIYSLLDFHQDLYNERFQGEGEPAWSVQDDGLPAAPQVGFPANYLVMPGLNRAFDHFWQNSLGPDGVGLQDRYAAAWQHVAAYFRGDRYVMGDDLFNEPWPGSAYPTCVNLEGCPVFDRTVLAPFMRRVIAAVRSADPRVVTYYEPNVLFDFGADTSIGKPGGNMAGMSFHDYCLPTGVSLNGLGGLSCATTEQRVLQNADAHAQQTGDALLLSEFGSTDDVSDIERIVDGADQHMVGWDYWAYCGCQDPTGSPQAEALVNDPAQPPTGPNVRAQKLAVLERPYPQAVSGTPISFSYGTASDTFRLSYSTARASGRGRFPAGSETDIYVPAIHYPHGYAMHVTGAVPTSFGRAPILRLRSCPGRARITVRVSPGSGFFSDCARGVAAGRGRPRHRRRAARPPRAAAPAFTG